MNRLMSSLAALATASLALGCATSTSAQRAASTAAPAAAPATAAADLSQTADPSQAPARVGSDSPTAEVLPVAQRTEVPVEKNAPSATGHPLTSVVVTQCNLIVAVYMTMSDGTLLRYDSHASIPADQLLQMAYTATRSERVEVSCNDSGAVGYEKHDPV